MAGDKIAYLDSRLYINGEPVPRELAKDLSDFDWLRAADFKESYTTKDDYNLWTETVGDKKFSSMTRKHKSQFADMEPIIIPEGQLFVMGDNRDNSSDSRSWGFLPVENVLGKAMFVWLSCEESLPVVNFLCDPTTLRWRRFFHSIH
jgi:signal peptidase I